MTSIDTPGTSTRAQEPPPTTERRKGVLICPTCGYESDATRNWLVRTTDEGTVYVCPECRSTVARR